MRQQQDVTAAKRVVRALTLESVIYALSRNVVFPLVEKRHTGGVEGLSQLPATGPYIVAANHSSFMDHFLIANLFYRHQGRKIYFLTRKESFENPLSRRWHLATGCISINRDRPEVSAFRTIRHLLKRGEVLVVYPEGTRSLNGDLLAPKPGIVRIALQAGVPIVPIGITGAHHILPKGRIVPRRGRADLRIGAPIDPTALAVDGGRDALHHASLALMAIIAGLAGKAAPVMPGEAGEVAAPEGVPGTPEACHG